VADVARTLVTALEFVAEGGVVPETIEVGPLTSNSVNDVAKMVAKAASQVTGKPPVSVTHLPMRPGEIPGAVVTADTSTLAQVGVDPTTFVSLEPGIKATVDYFDRSEGTTWNKP
jgi:UDP-glucose 4-epimerase